MGGERDSERERVCGSLCCTVRAFVSSLLQERERERESMWKFVLHSKSFCVIYVARERKRERERESMWKFFCTVKAFVSSRRRERENG